MKKDTAMDVGFGMDGSKMRFIEKHKTSVAKFQCREQIICRFRCLSELVNDERFLLINYVIKACMEYLHGHP